jgi:4'-phosphopantetheinyl transferase
MILDKKEVHIWHASLEADHTSIDLYRNMLSVDERERAAKFCFEKDRNHFIVARGILRNILSKYLDIKPSELLFKYNEYGKPELVNNRCGEEVYFNLSHSHGLALFAISHYPEIGIDIEYMRADTIKEPIAEHFFSKRESTLLRALPLDLQTEAFFNCWTRKEAYIKAIGKGLSISLDQFEVTLLPGEPAALLSDNQHPQEVCKWTLYNLSPAMCYIGALAVKAIDLSIKHWHWNLEHVKIFYSSLPCYFSEI